MLDDAFKFYYTATKLKDMLRQGAVQWNVNKPRLESIAEHTESPAQAGPELQPVTGV